MISDSSSQGSGRSLRSKGLVGDDSESHEPANAPKAVVRSRKPASHWTEEEEEGFLQFLCNNISTAGDGGFKAKTFSDASVYLKKQFPQQTGAEKTPSVCKSKWNTVSSCIYHM
jgi:hypothetical protein